MSVENVDNNDEKVEKKENEIIEVEKINEELEEKKEVQEIKENATAEKSVVTTDKPRNKKIRLIIILIISFFIAIFLLFGVIVCINKFNSNVYKNVNVLGYSLGGMSKEQVKEILDKVNTDVKSKKISVYQNSDEIYNVLSEEIDFEVNVSETLKNVMSFGRNGNILIDNFEILKALFNSKNIDVSYSYNEEKLDGIVKNIDLSIKERTEDDNYSIDEENKKIIITRGKSGNTIDYDTEKEKILSSFKGVGLQNITLDIKTKKPSEIDFEKIYKEIKRDAKDAYVDESSNPIKFVPEVVGLDLDVEGLKNELNKEENRAEGKVIEFPLKVTEPNVKIKDISSKYYNDKLSGKTTYFDASQTARANNLRVALNYLNGKVIMPGETFSYNQAIGDTTAAKGYMAAATFKGGTVVNEMGGGICQTTSTLYQAVLMANLEIVERHQHGLPVGYVKPSLDATVYSPVLDFKFKNTRNYPVKIVTSFSYSGNMNVSIYGIKEENEVEVTLTSQFIKTVPFTTKYVYDANLENGKQEIISKGVNGYISEGYITKSKNGTVISSSLLSRDTYNAQQQVVKVGTKNVAS